MTNDEAKALPRGTHVLFMSKRWKFVGMSETNMSMVLDNMSFANPRQVNAWPTEVAPYHACAECEGPRSSTDYICNKCRVKSWG